MSAALRNQESLFGESAITKFEETPEMHGYLDELIETGNAWDAQTKRLIACTVAEPVLPVFESAFLNDLRPRKAIEAARSHAHITNAADYANETLPEYREAAAAVKHLRGACTLDRPVFAATCAMYCSDYRSWFFEDSIANAYWAFADRAEGLQYLITVLEANREVAT